MNKIQIKKVYTSIANAVAAYEGAQSALCTQILATAKICPNASVLAEALLVARANSEDRNIQYYFSQLAKLAGHLASLAAQPAPKKGWRLYSLTASLVAAKDTELAKLAESGDKKAAVVLQKKKAHRAAIAASKTKKEPTAKAKAGAGKKAAEIPASAGEIENQPVIVDFLAAMRQCKEFFNGINGKAGVLYDHARQGKVAPQAIFQGMGKDLERLGSELARLIAVLEKETE